MEKRLAVVCALLMIPLFLLLVNADLRDQVYSYIQPPVGGSDADIVVARVKGAARLQGEFDLQSKPLHKGQPLAAGDTVFATDGSGFVIRLPGNNEIVAEAGSRVQILRASLDGPRIDLQKGKFRLFADGTWQVALGGVTHVVRAKRAEMEIAVLEGAAPAVKTVNGEGFVQVAGTERLQARDAASLIYIWKLGDLYESAGGRWKRKSPPARVKIVQLLEWEGRAPGYQVQIASTPDFSRDRIFAETKDSRYESPENFVGANYWRVSGDGKSWSPPSAFQVNAGFLDEKTAGRPLTQKAKPGVVKITWHAGKTISRFLAEVSADSSFPLDRTEVEEFKGSSFTKKFAQPGRYYVRARGVNARGELTEYSTPVTVNITAARR